MAINTAFGDNWSPDRAESPAAGRYHVAIVALKESGGRNNEMTVDYEVLAGSTPDQEGKIHRDYFAKTIPAMGRIHQLAIAVGMITVDELKQRQESGDPPAYEFERDAIGRQLMVELTEEEYDGKARVKCGFGLYHVTDPKVAKWPKNSSMLAASGVEVTQAEEPDMGDMFNGVV